MLSALCQDSGCPRGHHSPHGLWGEHSQRQRDHNSEPLVANPIFISYLMSMVRSTALTQELLFISTSPELRLPVMFAKAKGSPSSRGQVHSSPQRQRCWEWSSTYSWNLRYLMYLIVSAILEYVTLYFIFTLLPTSICEAAYTFCEAGLGGGICRRRDLRGHAQWKHDCQHFGPRGSVLRELEATRK